MSKPIVRSNKTKLKDYGPSKKDLEIETFDLIAKIIELLTDHDLWNDDGTYTFQDGERWAKHEELADNDEICGS